MKLKSIGIKLLKPTLGKEIGEVVSVSLERAHALIQGKIGEFFGSTVVPKLPALPNKPKPKLVEMEIKPKGKEKKTGGD